MGNVITPTLPHDLPENWTDNQYVTPGGVEAGLTPQHGFNYLMRQVNNAQRAILELDEGSAPSSLVFGYAQVERVGDVSSHILTWFNAMNDYEVKNFALNCMIGEDSLEGGVWTVTICRNSQQFGTVWAIKYPAQPSEGGVMVKACSIYNKNLIGWKDVPRIDKVVNKSGDTMTGDLTLRKLVPALTLNAPDKGMGQILKNANSSTDYGTHVIDTDAAGNKVTLTVRGHSANNRRYALMLSVEPKEGTFSTLEVLHTGNMEELLGVAPATVE